MTMEKLKKCRICLVENVRMIVVADKNLQDIYEKLTNVPFVTEDSRPMLACFLCCSKLKQSYQLQRKCLEAEELFAQMLNDDYERKPLINQGLLEFRSGFTTTATVHKGIVEECQTESIAIKEELPAVCEGLDGVIEPKEEHQSYELELENFDNSCLDVVDILVPPYHCESDLKDNAPLMEFKTEVEEEQDVSKKKRRAGETKKLEPGNLDNSCVDILVPPYHSASDLEDNVPLMEFKTEVEEEEVSKKKRRVGETTRATVAKKPKLDTRRTKLEDAVTAERTKKEKSDSKVKTKDDLTNGEKPYKCNVCQRSFSVKCSLIRHIRLHTGEKPYKCDLCQRSFSVKCSLFRHMRLHTGEKPYKCDLCQRSFSDQSVLTSHTRIHTGEKPFKCDICQCSFRQNGHLTEHIRIHTGEKPYKCDVCQTSFSYKRNLTQHIRKHTVKKPYHLSQRIRIHTGEKAYKCDVCQRSFSLKGDIIKHIRIHTGEKPFKCDVCERSFRQYCHLKRHHLIHIC